MFGLKIAQNLLFIIFLVILFWNIPKVSAIDNFSTSKFYTATYNYSTQYNATDYSEIYEVDITTGSKIGTSLLKIPRSTGIAMSPDGSMLYYTREPIVSTLTTNCALVNENVQKKIYKIVLSQVVDINNPPTTIAADLCSSWDDNNLFAISRLGVSKDGNIWAMTSYKGYLWGFNPDGSSIYKNNLGATTYVIPKTQSPVSVPSRSTGDNPASIVGYGGDIVVSSYPLAYIVDNDKNFWEINLSDPVGDVTRPDSGLKFLGAIPFTDVINPAGLAFGVDNNLYAVDSSYSSGTTGHRVVKIVLTTSNRTTIATFSSLPNQLGTTNLGDLNGRSADSMSAVFPDLRPKPTITVSSSITTKQPYNGGGTNAEKDDILTITIITRNLGSFASTQTILTGDPKLTLPNNSILEYVKDSTVYVDNNNLEKPILDDLDALNNKIFPCINGCSIESKDANSGTLYTYENNSYNESQIRFKVKVLSVPEIALLTMTFTGSYKEINLYGQATKAPKGVLNINVLPTYTPKPWILTSQGRVFLNGGTTNTPYSVLDSGLCFSTYPLDGQVINYRSNVNTCTDRSNDYLSSQYVITKNTIDTRFRLSKSLLSIATQSDFQDKVFDMDKFSGGRFQTLFDYLKSQAYSNSNYFKSKIRIAPINVICDINYRRIYETNTLTNISISNGGDIFEALIKTNSFRRKDINPDGSTVYSTNLSASNDCDKSHKIIFVDGDLTINSPTSSNPWNFTFDTIIFVSKNLIINPNIIKSSLAKSNNLIFVVKGNIDILSGVFSSNGLSNINQEPLFDLVEASLITDGMFRTYPDNPSNSTKPADGLTIKGSVIAAGLCPNNRSMPIYSSNTLSGFNSGLQTDCNSIFGRKQINTQNYVIPSERIIYDANILKSMLGMLGIKKSYFITETYDPRR